MGKEAEFIQWGPDLELGIPLLDAQHRSLVSLANRLYLEHKKGKRGMEAKRAVSELFAYSNTHFRDEEAFFARFKEKLKALDPRVFQKWVDLFFACSRDRSTLGVNDLILVVVKKKRH